MLKDWNFLKNLQIGMVAVQENGNLQKSLSYSSYKTADTW